MQNWQKLVLGIVAAVVISAIVYLVYVKFIKEETPPPAE